MLRDLITAGVCLWILYWFFKSIYNSCCFDLFGEYSEDSKDDNKNKAKLAVMVVRLLKESYEDPKVVQVIKSWGFSKTMYEFCLAVAKEAVPEKDHERACERISKIMVRTYLTDSKPKVGYVEKKPAKYYKEKKVEKPVERTTPPKDKEKVESPVEKFDSKSVTKYEMLR